MNTRVAALGFGAVLMMTVAPPSWADIEAGLRAYEQGDYATALTELRPLAEQGHAEAQVRLGWLYDQGRGCSATTPKP